MATLDAILSDVQTAYIVTMTNGSGTKELVLSGTQSTVWVWCCRVGEARGTDLSGYVPVGIRPTRPALPTIAQAQVACICGDRENYSLSCPIDGLR